MRFNGADYDPDRDNARLTGQLRRIWEIVIDGRWYTLKDIAVRTGDPEPSISAQLRHLRKPRFGGHIVEREYVANGLYKYRVLLQPMEKTNDHQRQDCPGLGQKQNLNGVPEAQPVQGNHLGHGSHSVLAARSETTISQPA
jgi:uncharacterized protein (DUF2132 family)